MGSFNKTHLVSSNAMNFPKGICKNHNGILFGSIKPIGLHLLYILPANSLENHLSKLGSICPFKLKSDCMLLDNHLNRDYYTIQAILNIKISLILVF